MIHIYVNHDNLLDPKRLWDIQVFHNDNKFLLKLDKDIDVNELHQDVAKLIGIKSGHFCIYQGATSRSDHVLLIDKKSKTKLFGKIRHYIIFIYINTKLLNYFLQNLIYHFAICLSLR